MNTLQIILMGLGILPIAALGLFAWLFALLWVVYPWKKSQLQNQADAWNDAYWDSGDALEVTVEVLSDATLGGETRTATLMCFEKKFTTQGCLRRTPSLWKKSFSEGPDALSIPFGAEADMTFPLRYVADQAQRHHKQWNLPHCATDMMSPAVIVAKDGAFRCAMDKATKTTHGEVTAPAIVEIRKIPVSKVISKDAYLALSVHERKTPAVAKAPSYSWRTVGASKCWSYRGAVCAPGIEDAVGRPFQ